VDVKRSAFFSLATMHTSLEKVPSHGGEHCYAKVGYINARPADVWRSRASVQLPHLTGRPTASFCSAVFTHIHSRSFTQKQRGLERGTKVREGNSLAGSDKGIKYLSEREIIHVGIQATDKGAHPYVRARWQNGRFDAGVKF
jgi:hypothetical protein